MEATNIISNLAKRINIPSTPTSPAGLIEANTLDPFSQSGKYALGWTYLCVILLVLVAATRIYHLWTDKLRQALYKEHVLQTAAAHSPDEMYSATTSLGTGGTTDQFFPRFDMEKSERPTYQHSTSSIGIINDTLALFRWIFYRPIPELRWKKHVLSFPSLAVTSLLIIMLAFVTLYCFLPQPLYWQSIRFGSPPLAIRAGELAISMTPWIIATSMKANLVSMITGISHQRLNVLHRWGGYLCLFLALVHTIPFYVQPVWDDGGLAIFQQFGNLIFVDGYPYGTGLCALVPLCWLVVASLPVIRTWFYEVFLVLHIPVAFVYVGMLFWHCQNFLNSYGFLYATCAIWVLCYILRLFKLNWINPWRMSWLIGEEAAITLMSENAIKVTIPTQMKWKPGQFVYLRMPGISIMDNHPFTISSLCSEDFPSEYGDLYRDCTLVFRPFGGFTRKVLDTAIEKGPFKTYRAYLEGPYGGMQRELAAFETVILFAGGSGITALVSQLLNLIKRMRDGKAVTRKIEVVWALKRLEAMDWFREELRICREYAPPDTVTCQFYVTAAVRQSKIGHSGRAPRPISAVLHDKLDGFVASVAEKRHSELIHDEAQGNPLREEELRAEEEDAITSLPQPKYLQPAPLPKSYKQRAEQADIARRESLRRLEGHSNTSEKDDHAATHRYLSPSTSETSNTNRREFHFPPPSPNHNSPRFQFAPPSPRRDANFNNGSHFPPPPQSVHSPETTVQSPPNFPPPPPQPEKSDTTQPVPAHMRGKSLDLHVTIPSAPMPAATSFDFGFPTTPTEFQKNLMRFAFVGPRPAAKSGWSTEYGRPDLAYMLKEMATGGDDGKGILGRRTCVFVCGPPGMRVDVANAVAGLQADIWGDESKDEIFLWTENYAI